MHWKYRCEIQASYLIQLSCIFQLWVRRAVRHISQHWCRKLRGGRASSLHRWWERASVWRLQTRKSSSRLGSGGASCTNACALDLSMHVSALLIFYFTWDFKPKRVEAIVTETTVCFKRTLTRIVMHKPRYSLVSLGNSNCWKWHQNLIHSCNWAFICTSWLILYYGKLCNSLLITYSLATQKQSYTLEWPLYLDGMKCYHGTWSACYIILLFWSSSCKRLPRQLLQIRHEIAQTLSNIVERFLSS